MFSAIRRVVCSRVYRGVLILLYHRVAQLRRDPWALSVSPEQFDQHLRVLQERTCPIRLPDIRSHLTVGTSRKPLVALTFDDGYADNMHQAEPLLRVTEIPATIFVVTGALRCNREFWWDELERIVFEPGLRQAPVQVNVGSEVFAWMAPNDGKATEPDTWQAWTNDIPTDAHRTYLKLYQRLVPLMAPERTALLDEMINQLALPESPRETHRTLSCAEITELARSPVIDIGVHTVTHSNLAKLKRGQQAAEVSDAKAELEQLAGRRLTLFSYPYGKREHYNSHTIETVRSAGFEYAFLNEPGIAHESTDPLLMPRVVVPPLNGLEFSAWLTHCLVTMA